MKKATWLSALSISILSINIAFASPQDASSQIKDNATHVLSILKQANGKNDAAVRKQAENYALPYFDFALMTRLSVAEYWNKANEEQKQILVSELRTLLIRTYSGQMLRYKNAQVVVKNATPKPNPSLPNKQQIDVSTIITNSGQHQSGNQYKVFNVVFEGALALVQNQKKQFKPILQTRGVEGLIADLKAKNGHK